MESSSAEMLPSALDDMVIFTDLDSSLLDEHYKCDKAKPIIETLKTLGIPLVLNSSKTVKEMSLLAEELGLNTPLLCENGGVIAYPSGSNGNTYRIELLGLERESILDIAHHLRDKQNFKFEGFSDWTAEQLAERTRLDLAGATLAQSRLSTEPILWLDSDEAKLQFVVALSEHSIHTVRGGEFICLSGEQSKALSMQSVVREMQTKRQQNGPTHKRLTVVAIGDSDNDLSMLELADIAVVIPRKEGYRIRPTNSNTIYATQRSTAGWVEAVSLLLERLTQRKHQV